jgi:hypothetical protein
MPIEDRDGQIDRELARFDFDALVRDRAAAGNPLTSTDEKLNYPAALGRELLEAAADNWPEDDPYWVESGGMRAWRRTGLLSLERWPE